MILGMSTASFTVLHVIISVIGIGSGFVVAAGMLSSQRRPGWTALFLATTILTSVTGFLFHSKSLGAPHVVGIVSLLILALALVALYGCHLAGTWRGVYVVTALAAQYLNCFVLVAQLFAKVPFLKALAPGGTEPPFAVAQLALLSAFAALGVSVLRRFRPAAPALA